MRQNPAPSVCGWAGLDGPAGRGCPPVPHTHRGEWGARKCHTKTDGAHEVAGLPQGRDAGCEKVTLVPDNPETHTNGAFYAAFEPQRVRKLVRQIELCDTPARGTWPNVAECGLRVTTRECLCGSRRGALSEHRPKIAAWSTLVSVRQRGLEWRMRIDDAHCSLKGAYSQIIL